MTSRLRQSRLRQPALAWVFALALMPALSLVFFIAFTYQGAPTSPDQVSVRPPAVVQTMVPGEAGPPPAARGTLHVVDEESGALIPGSRVFWLDEHPEERSTYYNPVAPRATGGEFDYAGPAGIVSFAVEAPGHVGTMHSGIPVEVPEGDGLDHEFRMERGGTLRVQFLAGGKPAAPSSVLVRFPRSPFVGGLSAVGMDARSGTAERDDLPEGVYGIEVQPGPQFEPVENQFVSVEKGRVTERTIELVSREVAVEKTTSVDSYNVRGTVRFHRGWGTRETYVGLLGTWKGPRDSGHRVHVSVDSPGVPVPFSLRQIPWGEYWVEVQPQWRSRVEVPPGGAEFTFDIPEPARVHIRVVEDSSGETIRGARLTWHCTYPGLDMYADDTEKPDPGTGAFSFLAPPGNLKFQVTARGWIPVEGGETGGWITLESGESREQTVRLQPAGNIRTLVRCNGQPLSRREVEVVLVFAEPVGDQPAGSVTYWLNGGPGLYRREDLPTVKYTLEIRDPRGVFEAVPPREVQVLPGQTTELVVDLRRRD